MQKMLTTAKPLKSAAHSVFFIFVRRSVNPYVTGSSPVARATDFPQMSAVFLCFCCGNLFWYKVPKNAKNDPKIIHFLHKFIHLLYQNFGYILLTRATPMPVRLSKDS